MSKKKALAVFLNESMIDIDDVDASVGYFSHYGNEYMVATEEEADERAGYIAADILMESLEIDQSEIDLADYSLDPFIQLIVIEKGRAHFLAEYDGEENEEGSYLIYRVA